MSEQAKRSKTWRMTVDGDSFEAVGDDEAALLALCRQWLETVKAIKAEDQQGEDANIPQVPKEIVERVFRQTGNLVMLSQWEGRPTDPADLLLMILWGFNVLKNMPAVPAIALTQSARLSGIPVDRVDRALASHSLQFQKTGTRKGTRYTLTMTGRAYAGRLLRKLAQ